MNLYQQAIETLNENGKSAKDVEWVGSEEVYFTWKEFVKLGQDETHAVDDLVIVGKDFWLERKFSDLDEWWEFKKKPKKSHTRIKPIAIGWDVAEHIAGTDEDTYSMHVTKIIRRIEVTKWQ